MKDNHYEPRHVRRYADAVDPRCTPIPEDAGYQARHHRKKAMPNHGTDTSGETIPDEGPVIPEEVDDFF